MRPVLPRERHKARQMRHKEQPMLRKVQPRERQMRHKEQPVRRKVQRRMRPAQHRAWPAMLPHRCKEPPTDYKMPSDKLQLKHSRWVLTPWMPLRMSWVLPLFL